MKGKHISLHEIYMKLKIISKARKSQEAMNASQFIWNWSWCHLWLKFTESQFSLAIHHFHIDLVYPSPQILHNHLFPNLQLYYGLCENGELEDGWIVSAAVYEIQTKQQWSKR